MAIALDRATAAIAERTDPTRRHLTDEGRRRARMLTLATLRGDRRDRARRARARRRQRSTRTSSRPRPPSTRRRSRTRCSAGSSRVLDYVQDPNSFIFGITEPIGNFLSSTCSSRCAWCSSRRRGSSCSPGSTAIAFVVSGLRPAITAFADARRDRRHGRLGPGDGHRLAGARGDGARRRVRDRDRGLGGGEPARRAAAAAAARHAADAAAARLHHPVHLPDAGVADPGRRRVGAVRGAGRDPAGDERACAASRRRRWRRPRRSARRARRCWRR